MKSKKVFWVGILTIVVLSVFNVSIAFKGSNNGLSLYSIGLYAIADEEMSTTGCNGSSCDIANQLQYSSLTDGSGKTWCCGVAAITSGKKSS